MVVGEPSLMGGEYGEEDERVISRLENTQFDPAVAGGMPGGGGGPGGGHAGMGAPGSMFAAGIDPSQMGMWGTPPPPQGPSMIGGRPRSSGTPHTPGSRIGTPSLQVTISISLFQIKIFEKVKMKRFRSNAMRDVTANNYTGNAGRWQRRYGADQILRHPRCLRTLACSG